MVNIGRWSPYEGGQLDRFHCKSNDNAGLQVLVFRARMYNITVLSIKLYFEMNYISFNEHKFHQAAGYQITENTML